MINNNCDRFNEKTIVPGQEYLVTGWLISLDGPFRGRDCTIYSGYNWIGSGENMDIRIPHESIAKSYHCAIVYDERHNNTYLVPGKDNGVECNSEPVNKPLLLAERQKIRIGELHFLYVALCEGDKSWNNPESFA